MDVGAGTLLALLRLLARDAWRVCRAQLETRDLEQNRARADRPCACALRAGSVEPSGDGTARMDNGCHPRATAYHWRVYHTGYFFQARRQGCARRFARGFRETLYGNIRLLLRLCRGVPCEGEGLRKAWLDRGCNRPTTDGNRVGPALQRGRRHAEAARRAVCAGQHLGLVLARLRRAGVEHADLLTVLQPHLGQAGCGFAARKAKLEARWARAW